MNKFKVGDKVRPIKGHEDVCGNYSDCRGTFVKIKRADNNGNYAYDIYDKSGDLLGECSCCLRDNNLELVEPKKEQPAKYALVTKTFVDKKELRKYLKEHKEEKLTVYSVKKKVDYRVTSVVSLKEK